MPTSNIKRQIERQTARLLRQRLKLYKKWIGDGVYAGTNANNNVRIDKIDENGRTLGQFLYPSRNKVEKWMRQVQSELKKRGLKP